MTPDGANEAQIEYWNGKAGEKWTHNQESQDQLVAGYGERALAAADLQSGERVIDVGCGCGTTTFAIARAIGPGGGVTGVDIARQMLARARDRAAEVPELPVTFIEGDASVHSFDEAAADAVFSRFGVMFFNNPNDAFANFARALRPGGRLAFVCWRGLDENEWVRTPLGAASRLAEFAKPGVPRVPGPFAFGEGEYIEELLAGAGFADVAIEPYDAPLLLGETIEAGMRKIVENSPLSAALRQIEPDRHALVLDAVAQSMAPFAGEDGVKMGGAVWIVTARR